jgi:hypothetical protein
MKKWHKSEVEANGTVWTINASTEDGRVMAEVTAASKFDGTVELQLTTDGNEVHLRILEGIMAELLTDLVGSSGSSSVSGYRVKKGLPNAYVPWTEAEEAALLKQWDAATRWIRLRFSSDAERVA